MVNCLINRSSPGNLPCSSPDWLGCVQIPFFRGIDSTFHQNACAVFFFLFFSFNISDNDKKWRPGDAGRQNYYYYLGFKCHILPAER